LIQCDGYETLKRKRIRRSFDSPSLRSGLLRMTERMGHGVTSRRQRPVQGSLPASVQQGEQVTRAFEGDVFR
jgi:hypothetical protein